MKIEEEITQTKSFRNEYHKATVNIHFTSKWMTRFYSDVLKNYELTVQQYNILRILKGQFPESATVKHIHDRMLDRMSDTSRIVELLRQKGLVERTICETDRRKMDVLITQKGIRLLREIEKEDEKMDDLMRSLNKKEVSQLNTLLNKLRSVLSFFFYYSFPLTIFFSDDFILMN